MQVIKNMLLTTTHMLDSQRDDSRWEALGNGPGIHTEGTVFGAGAGRRTSGALWGSPGVWFARQAETQTQKRQADQPRPSLSELRHPQAGGEGSRVDELLEVSPQWLVERRWSARLQPSLSDDAQHRVEHESEGMGKREREGGGESEHSPVYPRWGGRVCSAASLDLCNLPLSGAAAR